MSVSYSLRWDNKMFDVSEFGKEQNEVNPEVRVLIQYTSKEKATILILQTSCASCLLDQLPSGASLLCFRMFIV